MLCQLTKDGSRIPNDDLVNIWIVLTLLLLTDVSTKMRFKRLVYIMIPVHNKLICLSSKLWWWNTSCFVQSASAYYTWSYVLWWCRIKWLKALFFTTTVKFVGGFPPTKHLAILVYNMEWNITNKNHSPNLVKIFALLAKQKKIMNYFQ